MRGSLPLGRFFGIGVYVHWTFALLIAWLLFTNLAPAGGTLDRALGEIVFVCTVFVCIVLHEFGHALMAKRFGVRTRDITILPIGGVARLERMPRKPIEEFLVAIAGPAVNVAIAAVLWLGLAATNSLTPWPDPSTEGAVAESLSGLGFFGRLLLVNVLLVLFNLLPAFPMDGGRVLRALLAMKYDYTDATRIAAGVGQAMAVLFVIAGIFLPSPWLLLIAVFVYLGAGAEAQDARTRSAFAGVRVADAMVTDFRAMDERATLADAVEALLSGSQPDFPVVSDGRVVGVLPRTELLRALTERSRSDAVSGVMRRDCLTVREADLLDDVLDRVRESGCPMVPVLRDGRLVGLLTQDNMAELMMVRQAIRGRGGRTA